MFRNLYFLGQNLVDSQIDAVSVIKKQKSKLGITNFNNNNRNKKK